MQAWVFTDFEFWTRERVEAFLGGVEIVSSKLLSFVLINETKFSLARLTL